MNESFLNEDDDHHQIYLKIIASLSEEGYYKARISSYDAFDKIAGGMIWCLSFTEANIDSSYLFMENMEIAEKIFVSEIIINCLKDLNCSFKLDPHQILGFDLKNILPVIQWLICISSDSRKLSNLKRERDDCNWQFDQYFSSFSKKKSPFESSKLDYDELSSLFSSSDKHLSRDAAHNFILLSKNIDKMKISNVKKIDKINEKYASKLELLKQQYENLQHRTNQLKKENKKLESKLEELNDEIQQLENSKNETKKDFDIKGINIDEILQNISEFESLKLTQKKNRETYKNELKKLGVEFEEFQKNNGIESKKRLQQELIAKKNELIQFKESVKFAEESLETKRNRLEELKFEATDFPSIGELNFYQQRMFDIYNKMMTVQNQLSLAYLLYNNLSDVLSMLKKENSLIDSITRGFESTNQSSSSQIEFKKTLKNIKISTTEALNKIQMQFDSTTEKYKELQNKKSDILTLQNNYHKLLLQFKTKIDAA